MPRKRSEDSTGSQELEKKLIENIVELQKVHTNLLERFDKLSNQVGDLLTLFEMSARSFAQQPGNITTQKDKDFLDKIDKLLDQNKTLAKGLTIMEEKIRERISGSPERKPVEEDFQPSLTPNNKPLPHF